MIRSTRWLAGIACALLTTAAAANLHTLRAQARAGVPRAQFELGELYQYGVGRADHLEQALKWYERAQAKWPRAGVFAHRLAARLSPAERAWVQAHLRPASVARPPRHAAAKPAPARAKSALTKH